MKILKAAAEIIAGVALAAASFGVVGFIAGAALFTLGTHSLMQALSGNSHGGSPTLWKAERCLEISDRIAENPAMRALA